MDTRESLLRIGLELFAQAPYEAVGVQDIVTRAQVTKPTLYHHFGSKLGFYQAVFEEYAAPIFAKLIEKTHFERDLMHNLNEIALATLDFCHQTPDAYRMLAFALHISDTSEHHDFVSHYWLDLYRAMNQLFTEASEQHGNLRDRIELSTWTFLYALIAQAENTIAHPESFQREAAYLLAKQFMYGIFS